METILVASLLTAVTVVPLARAETRDAPGVSLGALNAPSFIAERERTARPFAHILFCKVQPDQCRVSGTARPLALTEKLLADLADINAGINRRIKPVQDGVTPMGADQWSLGPDSGDCEDYAITKRSELVQRGWPSDSLRLASAVTPQGQPHMVLVVRTSAGDLVLDNLTDKVLHWQATDLRWRAIQSADPTKWFTV